MLVEVEAAVVRGARVATEGFAHCFRCKNKLMAVVRTLGLVSLASPDPEGRHYAFWFKEGGRLW